MKKSGLSFNIIVKNEEHCIELCLKSIQKIADEIIITDTGSSDNTIEICKKYSRKIFHCEWNDDFSEARNFTKSKSSFEWIFLIDADERLAPEEYGSILNSIKTGSADAYICSTKNFTNISSTSNWKINLSETEKKMAGTASGWFPSDKIRLFKNKSEYFFSGHIHELIIDSIRANNGVLKDADFYIYHYGYIYAELDKNIKNRKLEFYEKLNEKKLARYNDIKSVFELAKQKRAAKKFNEAVKLFERCVSEKYRVAEVFNELSVININLGDYTKSLEYAKLSVQYDSANISAKNNLAISYWKIGDAGKAVEILKNVIDVNPAHSNAYSNLAAIYKSSGDNLNAGKMYVLAIHYNPNDIKTLENYAKLLLVEKKYVELDEIVCSILKLNPLNNFALENKGFSVKMKDSILNKEYENFFSEGVLFFNKNDFKQALKCFRKSLNLNPDLDECRKYAAECYLKLGDKKKYDIEINRK